MNLNTVKGIFLICVTIVLSFILFIARNEYIHRYYLVVAPNNDLYIFDKKNLTVNICNKDGCELIDTRLTNRNSIKNKNETPENSKMFLDNSKQALESSSLAVGLDHKNKDSDLGIGSNADSEHDSSTKFESKSGAKKSNKKSKRATSKKESNKNNVKHAEENEERNAEEDLGVNYEENSGEPE